MTFQLQPGDYIRTASVPEDKKQAVIDAFVKAGAGRSHHKSVPDWDLYEFVTWDKDSGNVNAINRGTYTIDKMVREVTLDQILGKPMLIEALRPGMLAKINPHGLEDMLVVHRNGAIMMVDADNPDRYVSNISYLTTTDYEIIPNDPVPWVPSTNDHGWVLAKSNYRTRGGAEQSAKIMKVINAICNMPGYGQGEYFIYWLFSMNSFVTGNNNRHPVMDFRFDTEKNAKAAAFYANDMIKEMEIGNLPVGSCAE